MKPPSKPASPEQPPLCGCGRPRLRFTGTASYQPTCQSCISSRPSLPKGNARAKEPRHISYHTYSQPEQWRNAAPLPAAPPARKRGGPEHEPEPACSGALCSVCKVRQAMVGRTGCARCKDQHVYARNCYRPSNNGVLAEITRYAISTAQRPQPVAPPGAASVIAPRPCPEQLGLSTPRTAGGQVRLAPLHDGDGYAQLNRWAGPRGSAKAKPVAKAQTAQEELASEQREHAEAKAERRKKASEPKKPRQAKPHKVTWRDGVAVLYLRMVQGDAAAAAELQRLPAEQREWIAAAAAALGAAAKLDTITPAALAKRMSTIERKGKPDARAGRGRHLPLSALDAAPAPEAQPAVEPAPATALDPKAAKAAKDAEDARLDELVLLRDAMIDEVAATEGKATPAQLDAYKLRVLRKHAEQEGRPFDKLAAEALYVGDLAAVPPRKSGRKPAEAPAHSKAWSQQTAAHGVITALFRRCGMPELKAAVDRTVKQVAKADADAFLASVLADMALSLLLDAETEEDQARAFALPMPPKRPRPAGFRPARAARAPTAEHAHAQAGA